MRAHRGLYVVAAIGATTLVLTGCSSDDTTASKEATTSIASLVGMPDYDTIDYNAQQRAIEEEIASCMREQGWEYIPVEYPDMGMDYGEYSDEDELKRLEREGFGIVYWTLNADNEEVIGDDPWATWEDPNTEYVESLTDAEREAYNEALWGSFDEVPIDVDIEVTESEDSTVEYDDSDSCSAKAQKAVVGDDPSMNPGFWDAVQPFYDDLAARFEADPRVLEINAEWSRCMKDAGYDFPGQMEFYDWVYEEFDQRQLEILGDDFYVDPFLDWSESEINEFFETATQDELDAMFASPELSAEQRSALEEVLADEIEVAVAEHKCSSGTADKLNDIYTDIEEKFALEHEDELRALAASFSDKK